MFQYLKKQSDKENMKMNLDEQINADLQGQSAKFHKTIEMEKNNVDQAQKMIRDQLESTKNKNQ